VHACSPSTQEAEARGSLEPGSSRPAWATWRDPVSKTKIQTTEKDFNIILNNGKKIFFKFHTETK
jgi:hypothetical protein